MFNRYVTHNKADNSERNAKILELYVDGLPTDEIARRIGLPLPRGRSIVSGVVRRAGIKNRGGQKYMDPVVAPLIVRKTFGRLTVLEQSGSDEHGHGLVRCLCSCGKTCTAKAQHVRNGGTQSCGCLVRETALKRRPLEERRSKLDGAITFNPCSKL